MGHLTRDPELKYTAKGSAIGQFGLGINRTWTENGEKKESATFVDITAFGKTAETLAQYAKKGMALFVTGRLNLDTWEDKATGQKRSKLGVILESFQFVGGKGEVKSTPTPQEKTSSPDLDTDIPF